VDAVAQRALEALAAGDEAVIREVLHPYLHWTRADGSVLRGRTRMLEALAGRPPGEPASVELRDGQIYRWTESTG
jgi:hypothetical protein